MFKVMMVLVAFDVGASGEVKITHYEDIQSYATLEACERKAEIYNNDIAEDVPLIYLCEKR